MAISREMLADLLAATIERHPKAWPEDRRVAMLQEWYEDVGGFKANDIEQALIRHRQQSAFPPKTADIIKILRPKVKAAKATSAVDVRDTQGWKNAEIACERLLENDAPVPEFEDNGSRILYAFNIPLVAKRVRYHIAALRKKRPALVMDEILLVQRQWLREIAWDTHRDSYKGGAE